MRKHRLVDCNPRWWRGCYLAFDCPEGHADCRHLIPFRPPLEPDVKPPPVAWGRTGAEFEVLSLAPSIQRRPTDHDPCALHIFIQGGQIVFCADSR